MESRIEFGKFKYYKKQTEKEFENTLNVEFNIVTMFWILLFFLTALFGWGFAEILRAKIL